MSYPRHLQEIARTAGMTKQQALMLALTQADWGSMYGLRPDGLSDDQTVTLALTWINQVTASKERQA